MCKASSGTAHPSAPSSLPPLSPPSGVRTFCTVSRRPAGPLAPPTRRARLRSRLRSRCGGARRRSAGAKGWTRAALQTASLIGAGGCVPAPAAEIVRGRSEPVKAVCDRRTTASVELPGERTREDVLDRTCPDLELAAIGSRDTSGQGRARASSARRSPGSRQAAACLVGGVGYAFQSVDHDHSCCGRKRVCKKCIRRLSFRTLRHRSRTSARRFRIAKVTGPNLLARPRPNH